MPTTKNSNIRESIKEFWTSLETPSVDGIVEKEMKDGSIAVKKEYRLINPIGNRETLTVFNPVIIQSVEKTSAAIHGKKLLNLAICREMARMNNKELLSELNMKSIAQYGAALFDFSNVTSNQYARIGRVFVGDDYKIKSDVLPSSLTTGHLIELLVLVQNEDDISNIEELYMNGTLTDGLSTGTLRKKIRAFKKAESAIEVESKVSEEPKNIEKIEEPKNIEKIEEHKVTEKSDVAEPTLKMVVEDEIEKLENPTMQNYVETMLNMADFIAKNVPELATKNGVTIESPIEFSKAMNLIRKTIQTLLA